MFEWMHNQTITVTPFLGRDGFGREKWGVEEEFKCRIEPLTKLISDSAGNEVVAGGFIMFPAGKRYLQNTKIEWEGIEHVLLRLDPIYSVHGTETHVEGWFKGGSRNV